jgi:hypothetical protein
VEEDLHLLEKPVGRGDTVRGYVCSILWDMGLAMVGISARDVMWAEGVQEGLGVNAT